MPPPLLDHIKRNILTVIRFSEMLNRLHIFLRPPPECDAWEENNILSHALTPYDDAPDPAIYKISMRWQLLS